MVAAARKYNRVVQVGTWQRSAPHFADAIAWLRQGELGKIRTVTCWCYLDWLGETAGRCRTASPPPSADYDLWLGPAPKRPFNKNRFHFTFRWFWDYSGGLMTDWGAHLLDVANWGMQLPDGKVQVPTEVMSIGGKLGYPNDAMETPDTQQVLFKCGDFSIIWQHAVGLGRGHESREHGIAFHGNNGVLVVDRNGWEVFPETDSVDKKRAYKMAGVPRAGEGTRRGPRPAREELPRVHADTAEAGGRRADRPRVDPDLPPREHRLPHRTQRQVGPGQGAGDRRPEGERTGVARVPRAVEAADARLTSLRALLHWL